MPMEIELLNPKQALSKSQEVWLRKCKAKDKSYYSAG